LVWAYILADTNLSCDKSFFRDLLEKRHPYAAHKGKWLAYLIVVTEVEHSSLLQTLGITKRTQKSSCRHFDHSSSWCSLNCLCPSVVVCDCSSVMDFLNQSIMISNQIILDLSDSEKEPYNSSFVTELNNAFLELCLFTLLVSQNIGDGLLKKGSDAVEKFKAELA